MKTFRPTDRPMRASWRHLLLATVMFSIALATLPANACHDDGANAFRAVAANSTFVFSTHAPKSDSTRFGTSHDQNGQDQDDNERDRSKERAVEGPIHSAPTAKGRPPIEDLVPATTKALVVIRDFDELKQRLQSTQFGKIFEQDELKTVVEEVRRKLEKNLTDANQQLGFTIDDIRNVRTGEVGFASMLPAPEGHAIAAVADVRGNEEAANELLDKVRKDLVGVRKAKALPDLTEGKAVISHFELPLAKGAPPPEDQVFLTLAGGFVLAADNEATIRNLVRSAENNQPPDYIPLSGLKAYRSIQAQVRLDADGTEQSDIRWFIEPFGLSDAIKNALPKGERRKDYANILKRQGFSAIEGIGGTVVFNEDTFEVLHRTFVLAPNSSGVAAVGEDRFELAARALSLENVPAKQLAPPKWSPPTTATYFAVHWDMLKAFDSIGTLVDEIVGSEGAFSRMLDELEHAHDGPRVNLRDEFVVNLGGELLIYSDIEQPIGLNSERMLLAIPIQNAEKVREALTKIMSVEDGIVIHEIGGRKVYEQDLSTVEEEGPEEGLDFPDDTIFNDPLANEVEEIETEESLAGWNTYTVTDEYLLVGNNLEFVRAILEGEPAAASLAESDDYQRVATALENLVGEEASIVQFGRQDEVMRVTFELLRQGKMPESQSLLGEFLNRQLGTGEPGVLREQQIDPTSLPQGDNAYDDLVAPFIGPSGYRCLAEPNGWLFVGGMLGKEQAVNSEVKESAGNESDDAESANTELNGATGDGSADGN